MGNSSSRNSHEEESQSLQRIVPLRLEDLQEDINIAGSSRTQNSTKKHPSLNIKRACVLENPASLKTPSLTLTQDKNVFSRYHISFKYDATVIFEIKLYYVCYLYKDGLGKAHSFQTLNGETPHSRTMSPGLDKEFHTLPEEALDLSKFESKMLLYEEGSKLYPVVIELNSIAENHTPRCERTMATLYKMQTSTSYNKWGIRPVRQEFQWDRGVFEMQRVYGIAGSENDLPEDASTALLNGRECVICLSAKRTTAVLPCRHMCLCDDCANIMRIQSDKCPICRQNVSSLLQLEVESTITN
ncbi:RING zinc finger protein [Cardiosporidium cionae]|uniref:RING-type E3 ubiquitin transferase n=1 Tax=Cardiosporidium cionae TaxID=476202 RepID=A0ABQ7J8J5_9APIC|nr:RING zinc finger protein [Cardiosporidium cionae]|eukprot:KAF8820316.1 RING zinc finger protein [Cardiosporidium cionae]